MYKVFTSLWSKPALSRTPPAKTRLSSVNSSDSSLDEDSWVFVTDTVLVSKDTPTIFTSDDDNQNSIMTTSWIASPPFVRNEQATSIDDSSPITHHFNPIENLLIEHASMSVYEQIASRTRTRRHRKTAPDHKLDEQIEDDQDEQEDEDDDGDDDGRSSVVLQYSSQHPNLASIHHRNLNVSLNYSTNSSLSALESSTSSLVAHQRHLHRIHQRRRRSTKTTSKLILSTSNATSQEESKLSSNKMLERQRLNYVRTPKLILHQPCRSNH